MSLQPNPGQPIRAVPAQAVPAGGFAGARPAQAIPAQAVPARPLAAAQAVPAQAVQAQAFAAQAVPAQAVAAQAVAAQAVPAQAVAARAVVATAAPVAAQPAHAVAAAPAPSAPPLDVSTLGRFERLLYSMEGYGASDLHLKTGAPVVMRIRGEMKALSQQPLSNDEIYDLLREVTKPEQLRLYDESGDLDFAYMLPNKARFRFNVFREKRSTALVVRRINTSIPNFEQMNLPGDTLRQITSAEDGLIVLAGVTGSGKSTTIAGMLDYINSTYSKHIITIEDPIEYEFANKKCYVSQREIGVDCVNFKAAIRTLVRQDPDVVLIGEMRDQETFEFGLTAAETGHLVFGTLHAGTVAQSIGRILGLFPPDKHPSLRQGLEFNLRAVICQKLLKSIKPGIARVPILEIMVCNPAIKKLIKEGKDKEINTIVARREDGMMLFDQCIVERCNDGYVSREQAIEAASNPEQLKMALQGIQLRAL
jgi:twitching motility protein PilT